MKQEWLLNKLETIFKRDNRFFLTYNSLIEEALKLVLEASKTNEPIVVIKENNFMANRLREILTSYFDDDELITYLPEESLRSEEIATSFENRAERLHALYKILTSNTLKLIITSPYGVIRHLPNKETLLNSLITLRKDQTCNSKELVDKLFKLGYEKCNHVETPMTYATRGYIVDVYSVNYELPIRIEFFDDVIDSIRFFDVNTQRTIEQADEVTLCFAKDVFFNEEEKNYLKENIKVLGGEMELNLEYIYSDNFRQNQYLYRAYFENEHLTNYLNDHLLYLSDKEKIIDHLRILTEENVAYIQEMHDDNKLPLKFSINGDYKRIIANERTLTGDPYKEAISKISEIDIPNGNLEYTIPLINKESYKYKVIILKDKKMKEVIEALTLFKIPYNLFKNELKEGFNIIYGDFFGGFGINDLDLAVYSSKELFKETKHLGKFATKYAEARTLNSYEELNQGDYVVHDQYGIGQYVSIETREVNGVSLDYLRIIYKGNDELLVPLNQFSLVRKYVSKEGAIPKLHKLGSKEWKETKKRVEESVDDIAERLIELYSSRDTDIGFAFNSDDELQKEFEDAFEYELTDDQKVAIKDVKKDMESTKPMDRLLCGDVGFGKTEVAIRAAFKATNSNKQVAYLCPTTILSLQHFNTFKKRFSNFPGRVELLNRYVSPAKQKEILNDLKQGKVDILIGTHRILSKDVEFKDLGLLIIDEEQRFGVEHKEKIKEFKKSIDVLSLSATPIPRTLQMSLIGIRGLSTLDTPPLNRYPVQTYVVYKSKNLLKEVILRELERGGQVFYLFNNVDRIFSLANQIQKEIPYAKVDVAHGKMDREEIEEVMYRFYNNETNVLICTTIIETGIDIPNANTIIVENAQNFGLSQLYQIKGRVGRSDRIAYAYLFIPEKKELNETSQKRLEAIKEFASLGSGYKIAMRDLTIRGAGDLLGPKQSGFIDNVGLDLYLSMLNTAIRKKKGEEVKEKEIKPIVNIPLESYIPDSFNNNDYEKLSIYHELDLIEDAEELLNYYVKVQDEYGKLPSEVKSLFEKKRLELLINLNYIDKISNTNGKFMIVLSKEYSDTIDGVKLFTYCNEVSKDIFITYKNNKLILYVENQKDAIEKILELVKNLENLRKDEIR